MRCGTCGTVAEGVTQRCPLDPTHVLLPTVPDVPWPAGSEPNPFIRYRTLLHAYGHWRSLGGSDTDWAGYVTALGGDGFHVTPVRRIGEVVAKDETRNVAHSHKARHLFGTLLSLSASSFLNGTPDDRPLAIASCGNAALAAAVLAAAAHRRLLVFVPSWADRSVVASLESMGASVTRCAREPGEVGDPSVAPFRAAVADGAIAFTCQGTDNALALDGGRTIGWELIDQATFDRVVVQVGGGALAASVALAMSSAVALGRLTTAPPFFAVQAIGAAPLVRAWDRASARATAVGWDAALAAPATDYMWPWDSPSSAATGILDDETYDWLAIVRACASSGGAVLGVSETEIAAAAELAGPPVGPTGAAGLAGALRLRGNAAVILTGRT